MHLSSTDFPIPLRPTTTVATDSSTSSESLRQHLVSRKGKAHSPGLDHTVLRPKIESMTPYEVSMTITTRRLMTIDFVVVRPSSTAPPLK